VVTRAILDKVAATMSTKTRVKAKARANTAQTKIPRTVPRAVKAVEDRAAATDLDNKAQVSAVAARTTPSEAKPAIRATGEAAEDKGPAPGAVSTDNLTTLTGRVVVLKPGLGSVERAARMTRVMIKDPEAEDLISLALALGVRDRAPMGRVVVVGLVAVEDTNTNTGMIPLTIPLEADSSRVVNSSNMGVEAETSNMGAEAETMITTKRPYLMILL